MKRFLALVVGLAVVTSAGELNAQNAARGGSRSGVRGTAVAIGIGVVAAIAAIALISNNSSSHSH